METERALLKITYWYKKEIIKQTADTASGSITVYRCPHYIPSNPTGKTRILHDLSFLYLLSFDYLFCYQRKKYDVVINLSPPLMPGLLAILYKKIKKVRFILPYTRPAGGCCNDLHMIRSKKLLQFLFGLEKYILKHAEIISSISPGNDKENSY
jgi:colanic acid biosynthesis glycosyl transferase WcaI